MKTEQNICLGCKQFDARWCPDCRIKSEKEALSIQRKEVLNEVEKVRNKYGISGYGYAVLALDELKKRIEEERMKTNCNQCKKEIDVPEPFISGFCSEICHKDWLDGQR